MAQPQPQQPTQEQEKIVNGFNKLRREQRFYSAKISEFEADLKEHRLVIDALKDINDEKRGCYRLVGGVLVGRTVGEVLPSLEKNIEQISNLNEQFKKNLIEKGREINDYMAKNNLRIVDQSKLEAQEESIRAAKEKEAKESKSQSSSAVLVGQ